VGVEGSVNVRSIYASVNVICFESSFLYSSSVILCCVGGSFPWGFYRGTVSAVDCKFSHWVTCISQRREMTAVFAAYQHSKEQWLSKRKDWH